MLSPTLLGAVAAAIISSNPGSLIAANPIARAITNASSSHVAPEIVFEPANHHLVPTSSAKDNLVPTHEDNFYWAHDGEDLFANMTVTPLPTIRLLNERNFVDLVQSVDCSNPQSIKIAFKTSSSLVQARHAWSTTTTTTNTLIFVSDSSGCGGQHGRQPYQISAIAYDQQTSVATLAIHSQAQWTDFIQDATVKIGDSPLPPPSPATSSSASSDPNHNQKLARRLSYSKKVLLNLDRAFNTHFYDADIGPAHLSVSCADCGLHGSLATDITVSTKHGFSASALTTSNVNLRLAVAITASAAITTSHLSQSIPIVSFPLADFKISNFVHLTPEVSLAAVISVTDIKGSVTVVAGAELDFPDGQAIDIGHSAPGTGLNPTFKRIGPTVSGKVDATARINPLLSLDISGKILSKHVTGGIGLAAPYLALAIGADVNGPNPCAPGATSTVHFSVNVGVELDTFYGFGSPGDEPNKHPLYQKDYPLLNECIAISH